MKPRDPTIFSPTFRFRLAERTDIPGTLSRPHRTYRLQQAWSNGLKTEWRPIESVDEHGKEVSAPIVLYGHRDY